MTATEQDNDTACTGPTIEAGTVSACAKGAQVEVPITISDRAGITDLVFSLYFDNTTLQYTGRTAGDMDASLLIASNDDVNAAGEVNPVVTFAEDSPVSGTIVKFKFTLISGLAQGSQTDLDIGDIIAQKTYCAESGAIKCTSTSECSVWDDVIKKYSDYVSGKAVWDDVITCYSQYVAPKQ